MRVEIETWARPDRVREVVRTREAAAVVALTRDRSLVLVRQLREPVREHLLELPAGLCDAGEAPEDTARRELEEETGYRVRELTPLGAFFTSAGFTDERIHLYAAEAEPGGRPTEDPAEPLEVVLLPFDRALRMAEAAEIPDTKTALGILLARDRL